MARPTRLNAGDGITWTESTGTASAVVYYYQDSQGNNSFSVTATIAAGVGTFSLAGDDTEGESPGIYTVWRAKTEDGLRTSSHCGQLIVAPNVDGSSPKTHAQTAVALLEAHVSGRLAAGLEGHTIDGQTIQKMSIPDARVMLLKYRRELEQEQAAFTGNAGNSGRILHRFTE